MNGWQRGWDRPAGSLAGLAGWPRTPLAAQTRAQLDAARQRMVQTAIIDAGVQNSRVIDAMRRTPRHEFIPRASRKLAYEDMALPIGEQQTISSPFIVAFMTEAIDPQPTDRVLEIGTGSGYQAAVLSGLVKEVYTIEIVEPLGRTAQRTLEELRYANVHVKIGDGFQGWPEHAPFDKIIVTCSPESVPQPLVDQLQGRGPDRYSGRTALPAGAPLDAQARGQTRHRVDAAHAVRPDDRSGRGVTPSSPRSPGSDVAQQRF